MTDVTPEARSAVAIGAVFANSAVTFGERVIDGDWPGALALVRRAYRLEILDRWWAQKRLPVEDLRALLPNAWLEAEPATELRWWPLFRDAGYCGHPPPSVDPLLIYRGGQRDDPVGMVWLRTSRPRVAPPFAGRERRRPPTMGAGCWLGSGHDSERATGEHQRPHRPSDWAPRSSPTRASSRCWVASASRSPCSRHHGPMNWLRRLLGKLNRRWIRDPAGAREARRPRSPSPEGRVRRGRASRRAAGLNWPAGAWSSGDASRTPWGCPESTGQTTRSLSPSQDS